MRAGPLVTVVLPYAGCLPGDRAERSVLDLGSGVYGIPFKRFGADTDDHVGMHVGHFHEDGRWCEGALMFEPMDGRPTWDVSSWEPLTITPSVLRTDCGLHGWITEGQWVAA